MPQEFNLKVTFDDMAALKDGLVKLREAYYVNSNVEEFVKYDWMVRDVETNLVKRAEVADRIHRIFGSTIEEDPKYTEALAEGKRQRDALKALEAAEALEAADD